MAVRPNPDKHDWSPQSLLRTNQHKNDEFNYEPVNRMVIE